MAAKPLKSMAKAPSATTAALRQVATGAGRALPPAIARSERRTVLVNVKMAEESAIALAKQAAEEGITQKQLICRALAVAGVPMDPLDLEDRTPRRRAAA
jgi:hypothetical protein